MNLNQVKNYTKGVLQGWFLNKPALDKISESDDGKILYNNSPIQDSYSKEEFDEILKSDYKQIFDKDSNIELLEEPVSFTVNASSSMTQGKMTNINTEFNLNDLSNFDYIIINIKMALGTLVERFVDSIILSTKNIVFNNSDTANTTDNSQLMIMREFASTSSGCAGALHIGIYYWFKDNKTIYVQQGFSSYPDVNAIITIDYIIGTKFNSTEIYKETSVLSKAFNYSLEEQCIGSWINGKPLYEKIFSNITMSSNSSIEIDISDLNYETVVNIDGRVLNAEYNHWLGLSNYYASNIFVAEYVNNNSKVINIHNYNRPIADGYVTIQYTKTTDEENSFTPDMLSTNEIDDTITDEDIENLMTQIKEG